MEEDYEKTNSHLTGHYASMCYDSDGATNDVFPASEEAPNRCTKVRQEASIEEKSAVEKPEAVQPAVQAVGSEAPAQGYNDADASVN